MAATDIRILDVVIFSIDKNEDTWEIEGELLFEADLSSPFEVTYLTEEDELEDIYIEMEPGSLDKNILKEKILKAASQFEE